MLFVFCPHHEGKPLRQAAFNAWVTLGEMVMGNTVSRAEIRNAYEVLERALEEHKKATKPFTLKLGSLSASK